MAVPFFMPAGVLFLLPGGLLYCKVVIVMDSHEKTGIIIDAVAVLLGDYDINKKYAAILLLKALLPSDIVKSILEDDGIYPIDRNDPRVRAWTKKIISRGKCEYCGSTENLEAHHIVKWSDYPKGRIDVNNGMCLCHRCHTEEHKDDQSYWMMKAKIV